MDGFSDDEVAPVSMLPNNSTVNFPKELYVKPLLKKQFLEMKQELEDSTHSGTGAPQHLLYCGFLDDACTAHTLPLLCRQVTHALFEYTRNALCPVCVQLTHPLPWCQDPEIALALTALGGCPTEKLHVFIRCWGTRYGGGSLSRPPS